MAHKRHQTHKANPFLSAIIDQHNCGVKSRELRGTLLWTHEKTRASIHSSPANFNCQNLLVAYDDGIHGDSFVFRHNAKTTRCAITTNKSQPYTCILECWHLGTINYWAILWADLTVNRTSAAICSPAPRTEHMSATTGYEALRQRQVRT